MNTFIKFFTLTGSRYFILAGIFFYTFYVLLYKTNKHKKIQKNIPSNRDYVREISFSIFTLIIFSLIPTIFIGNPDIAAGTLLYKKIEEKGWVYFILIFPVMIFLHDTYFYWTHRLMHHKSIFKIFHLVHHKSTNPSPWAAYAFHPFEALVEAGIFVIFLYVLPMHQIHFFVFFFFTILYNVYGHLGWELNPKDFNQSRIGKWINTSVSHNQHHQYFKGNYGLYLLFWDRMMGTIREDYDETYKRITNT